MARTDCMLIVIDPTADQHPALDRGMYLAGQLDMRVELFICDYQPQLIGATFLDSSRRQRAKEQLTNDHLARLGELAEKHAGKGVQLNIKAAWDRPLYEGIVRQALECDARYVLKDTHYHTGISRALFTNTDWHLIQSCPAPLWLVKPERVFDRPTILAAVDPMHEHDASRALDMRILSEAFELVGKIDGVVEALHVFNPYEHPDIPEHAEEVHGAAFATLTENLQIDPKRIHLLAGSATDLLPAIARERAADLVIMGAVSRSRLEHAVIGSTAESVLDHLPCDVLVIKPKGYLSPVTFKSRPRGYFLVEQIISG